MLFIIILAVLFAERYLLEQEDFRQHLWFRDYCRWFRLLPMGDWLSDTRAALISLLLMPVAVILIIHGWTVDTLQGIPEWVFAFAVLIFSLGPRDLEHQVSAFLYARDNESEEYANRIASEIMQRPVTENEPERSLHVSESVLEQANNRLTAVLFWFIILGPIGAVIYRLAWLAEQYTRDDSHLENMREQAFRLLHILNWIPARLLAATFALVGNFDNTLLAWRHWNDDQQSLYDADSNSLLRMTGSAAMGHARSDEQLAPVVEDALGLVLRSLTIWVVALGLLQLIIWLS